MSDTLLTALALIPALIFAIVFHEVAHGWTALALGDPTARERRRLSFNPIRHVDPIGTLLLPGMLALAGLPVFGWAKPVPVTRSRLDNPRFGMMAVAAAGPLTNLLLAAVGAILLGGLVLALTASSAQAASLLQLLSEGASPNPATVPGFALLMLTAFILINIFLALFNLLPIPPFDGSHIVEGLLPPKAAQAYDKVRPYGFPLLFFLLLVIPWLFPGLGVVEKVIVPPVIWAQDKFFALAQLVVGA
jgi:Zn-dependent protease